MKHFVLFGGALLTTSCITVPVPISVPAKKCPIEDGDDRSAKVQAEIQKMRSCGEAAALADLCGGDGAGARLAKAAGKVCARDYRDAPADDRKMLEVLKQRCRDKFDGQQASLSTAAKAFCELRVDQLFAELFSPAADGG